MTPWPARGDVEVMVMPKRTFQKTLGFWFAFASLNGFFLGLAVCVAAHDLGWWT